MDAREDHRQPGTDEQSGLEKLASTDQAVGHEGKPDGNSQHRKDRGHGAFGQPDNVGESLKNLVLLACCGRLSGTLKDARRCPNSPPFLRYASR